MARRPLGIEWASSLLLGVPPPADRQDLRRDVRRVRVARPVVVGVPRLPPEEDEGAAGDRPEGIARRRAGLLPRRRAGDPEPTLSGGGVLARRDEGRSRAAAVATFAPATSDPDRVVDHDPDSIV